MRDFEDDVEQTRRDAAYASGAPDGEAMAPPGLVDVPAETLARWRSDAAALASLAWAATLAALLLAVSLGGAWFWLCIAAAVPLAVLAVHRALRWRALSIALAERR